MNNSPINSTINSTTVGELEDATSLSKFPKQVLKFFIQWMAKNVAFSYSIQPFFHETLLM